MTALLREAEIRLLPLDVDFDDYRRQVIFRCFKWDPQVEDVATISDHACVLTPEVAARLSRLAELLAAETLELENALARRPDLFSKLGIPRSLRKVLSESTPAAGARFRVMRFDFHPTLDGWAVSEVNSDVPGGFAEASELPRLAASHLPGTRPGGDVVQVLVSEIAHRIGVGRRIGLIHATSYADDRQVMQFLASRLTAAGFECALLAPDHLRWVDGKANSIAEGQLGPIDGIVRFFPAEWLPALPVHADWRGYFRTETLSCNPPQALLSQSKRLPLVWDCLGPSVPTWRTLLPETRDTRDADWRHDDHWLLKPAFGRVGEGVAWRGHLPVGKWRRQMLKVVLSRRHWLAQRRFQSRPIIGRCGPRHLCIGVFTVDGRAAGFYGRLSKGLVIEKQAEDVPVLVLREPTCP